MTDHRKWKIIDNTAQTVYYYNTRREWREAAQQMRGDGDVLKRSPTDDRTLYTEGWGYIPGRGL